jgi:Protein of unknown function (DUF4241)
MGDNGRRSGAQDSQLPGGERAAGQLALPEALICTPDLDRLLTAGARYSDGQADYVIQPHLVGRAVLPTGGQLAVCDEPAMRWECAPTDGRYPHPAGDAYHGYPVDAGVATLADLVAVRALASWDYDRVEEVYVPRLPEMPVPGAVGAVTDEQTGANVIIVESGWGDGVYPTFVGYTTANAVASFVTDFMAVP